MPLPVSTSRSRSRPRTYQPLARSSPSTWGSVIMAMLAVTQVTRNQSAATGRRGVSFMRRSFKRGERRASGRARRLLG